MEQAIGRAGVRSMPELIQELVAQAQDPPQLLAQPGKFAAVTWLLAGGAALCGIAGAIGVAPRLTLPFALVLAGLAAASFVDDLLLPSPRDRRSAHEAATCFGRAIHRHRWPNAYACLYRVESRDQVKIPELPLLAVPAGETSLSTLGGFKRYWKAIVRGSGSTIRVCRKAEISMLRVDGDHATGCMTLTVERASSWTWLGLVLGLVPALLIYKATARPIAVEYRIVLFRHRSQWWMLPPSFVRSGPAPL